MLQSMELIRNSGKRSSFKSKTKACFKKTVINSLPLLDPADKIIYNKLFLMLAMISQHEDHFQSQLNSVQQEELRHHQTLSKKHKLKGKNYSKIEPINIKKQNLIPAYNFMVQLKKRVIDFLIKRNQQRMQNHQQIKDNNSSKRDISLNILLSVPTLKKLSIHPVFTRVQEDSPKDQNNFKAINKLTPFNEISHFKAKKKQQIYFFIRLNKSIQHYSLNQQHKVCIQILQIFSCALRRAMYAVEDLNRLNNRALSSSKFSFYLRSMQYIFQSLKIYFDEIIENKSSTGRIKRNKVSENTMVNENFEKDVNKFISTASIMNERVRVIQNMPDLHKILSSQKKQFYRLLAKLTQARYTLNYLLKQAESATIPLKKHKSIERYSQSKDYHIGKDLWKQAYNKKFAPRLTNFLR